MNDSRPDTLEHMLHVHRFLGAAITNLHLRQVNHDLSKLEEPEKSGYDRLTTQLKEIVYGSDAYRTALEEAREIIAHHYAANDHHPEHYPNGISGMSLLSLLEMIADWKAASLRTKQGSIEASLAHNIQRWGIDPQLAQILTNTVREMGW